MTIEEFCYKHEADDKFKEWSKRYSSMSELWEGGDDWEKLVWTATRKGMMNKKDSRLFCCWCARQMWHKLDDESKKAVEVSERYAVGEANKEELEKAREYVCDAAWKISEDDNNRVAKSVAWCVTDAVCNDARQASFFMIQFTVVETVGKVSKVSKDEIRNIVEEAQVEYLRKNCKVKV